MKARNRIVSIILAVLIVCTIISPISLPVSASSVKVFSQISNTGKYYYNDMKTYNTISASACGPFSLKNAIYYLTGIEVGTRELCDYASEHGFHPNGGTAYGYFKSFLDNKGKEYGVKYDGTYSGSSKISEVKKWLMNGSVAVCLSPGHFMTIADYDTNSGKYLLLDSAANSNNRPLTKGKGAVWLTEKELLSVDKRGTMKSFWIVSLLDNSSSQSHQSLSYKSGRYKINTSTDPLNMRSSANGSSTVLTKIPKGAEVNVTSISGEWGKTTYNNVTGWINLGYCTYLGASTSTEQAVSFSPDPNSQRLTSPGTLTKGKSYKISGTVKVSGCVLTGVSGGFYSYSKGSNIGQTGTYSIENKTSYSLMGTSVDNAMKFGSLASGKYYYYVTFKTNSSKYPTVTYRSSDFTVVSSVTPAPTISIGEEFIGGKNIVISGTGTLYYSLNNSDYRQYTGPIRITSDTSVNAYAVSNGTKSDYAGEWYITVGCLCEPFIDYERNSNGASVTISAENNASILYSTDGYNYQRYNGTFQVYENCTVYAKAERNGYITSDVSEQHITVSAPAAPVVYLNGTASDIAVGDAATVCWQPDKLAASYTLDVYKSGELYKTYSGLKNPQYAVTLDGDAAKYTFKCSATNRIGTTACANSVSVTTHNPSKVKFVDYDGKELQTQTVRYGYDAKQPEKIPSRRGYTFTGWDRSFYAVKENITVTAQYLINTYTVKFYDTDNKYLTSQKITFGSAIDNNTAKSKVTLKTGYAFKGWYVRYADNESGRDYNFVDSDMELVAVTGWGNENLPVVITNLTAEKLFDDNLGTPLGYDVNFKISSIPGKCTKGKIVVSLLNAQNKTLAVNVLTDYSLADAQNVPKNVFVSYDGGDLATTATVNVLSLDGNDRTGGLIAQAASCTPIYDVTKYAVWSAWMDKIPAGVTEVTQSKTVYRSRNNTKNTITSTSSTAPSGYSYLSQTLSDWGAWSGWSTSYVAGNDLRQVQTQWVNPTYKTQYKYFRYVNSARSWSGYKSGTFSGYVCNIYETTGWLDYALTQNATRDGHARYGNYGSKMPSCWYLEGTRQVEATAGYTLYSYRDRHYIYTYYRWDKGNWSDWGDTKLTANADGSMDVESKTVYRYIVSKPELTELENSGTERTISFDGSTLFENKDLLATIMIYKSKNTDPTESQLEFIGQTTLGNLNGYKYITKEEPTSETGDFVIAIAVEGYDGLINIGMVEAPKEQYTVIFQDEDGNVISEQTVEEGKSAVVPAAPEKEGYDFIGWDQSTTNVNCNLTVSPIYYVREYVVAFVDYLNQTCELVRFHHGDSISLPDNQPSHEGYKFKGWTGAESAVTADTVVTADWEANTYTVNFYNVYGTVLETQTVEYGKSANPPANIEVSDNQIFLGWSDEQVWWNVTQNVDVYPLTSYKTNAQIMTNSQTYVMEPNTEVSFFADTDSTIIYTTDGSMPDLMNVGVPEDSETGVTYIYDGALNLSNDTYILAMAVGEEKNDSEVINVEFIYTEIEDDISDFGDDCEIGTYTVDVTPGQSVTLNLNISDNPGLIGYKFYIDADPSIFGLATDEETGEVKVSTGSVCGNNGMLLVDSYEVGLGWKVLWFGTEATEDAGTLCTIPLIVNPDAVAGKYDIKVKYSVENTITKEDAEYQSTDIDVGCVFGGCSVSGDVNGDGKITTADIIRIARFILGDVAFTNAQTKIADVNGDGSITNSDVIRLAKQILGMTELN